MCFFANACVGPAVMSSDDRSPGDSADGCTLDICIRTALISAAFTWGLIISFAADPAMRAGYLLDLKSAAGSRTAVVSARLLAVASQVIRHGLDCQVVIRQEGQPQIALH
ncbi:hypothetical protein KKG90_06785 [Candidatus Bipolaricaulota bacterium]|nr:hypothetical protein [Candidatus Bipolaricaulota bacterium]